ncbi:MAG: histidinol dehydrogenase [Clostridia bacterium]|nr:histidinol dehydrogenase [Clostridia bacterium]
MIKILNASECEKDRLLMRSMEKSGVGQIVSEIIDTVRVKGDAALFEYAERFDHAVLSSLEVDMARMTAARERISPELLHAMTLARENIIRYHKEQIRSGYRIDLENGVYMGQLITPIARVGLYIPGGTAAYPSSVFMNAIPAKLAGCSELVMVTPPRPDGSVPDAILAAAEMAGVDRVFTVGGAQAVAALAYGTETIPKVDKIVGPGNAFVAEAKRQVFGHVAIDMIAGPSEILVIADGLSNPQWVAADLLSQAEHDRIATAVLITDSSELAVTVQSAVEAQLATLPREGMARESIDNNGKIILVDSLEAGVELANTLAPEHLELCVDEPEKLLPLVANAGSVFMGRCCPESLGDYLAGPNHILPTSGTARFSSALGVDDFIKKIQYTCYTQPALAEVADDIAVFARAEGLEAHARAALIREEKA